MQAVRVSRPRLAMPDTRLPNVIAREGVKFGINFTSCSEDGNVIALSAAECYFAVIANTSGIYPKISLLPVLSHFNTIASFIKVKISYFQTHFHNE